MHDILQRLPQWLRDFDYSRYLSDNYVVVDFETTIIDKGSPYDDNNKIVCSSYRLGKQHPQYNGNKTTVIIGSEFEQEQLVQIIEEADFWIAHNAKFEYGWLQRCGLPLNKSLSFCTMLAEYVLISNRMGNRLNMLSLDKCLKRRKMGGKEDLGKKLLKAGICPSTWPKEWLVRYSAQDVDVTEELFLNQRETLIATNQLRTVYTRNILTPPLVDIERRGMHIDAPRVKKLHHDYTLELQRLESELSVVTGGANPRSHPQMREILYEKLKFKIPTDKKWLGKNGDTPTTKFEYIDTLKTTTKKQRIFKDLKREYGKVNAALTKTLNKFNDCVLETEDHILTASFNQAVTATQRLSSTGKNYRAQFQNFDRKFKPLISPRHKDWKIIEIDQGQLEYRTVVWYGQDEAGMYDIAHSVDAHGYTASIIFKEKWDKVKDDLKSSIRKTIRTSAKEHTFKPIYGGMSGTPREVQYYEAFKKKHRGVTAAQNTWKKEAVNTGKVTTPTGLIFYFPGTRILADGYITNSTNICNYPVQMLASADIVPIGVVYQWYMMQELEMESFLVNTVHDSSIGEVKPDEIEQYKDIGEYCFTEVVYTYLKKIYDIDFNVPLEVEAEVNDQWANSKDWEDTYLA